MAVITGAGHTFKGKKSFSAFFIISFGTGNTGRFFKKRRGVISIPKFLVEL